MNDYTIITCNKLDYQFINKIKLDKYKDRKRKLAIQVKNTKNIDKNALRYLIELTNKYNFDVKISVIGPYSSKFSDSKYTKEKNFYNSLYNLDELFQIISEFEIIESQIDPKWNEFDKVVFLIEIITRNIMYDPEYWLMYKKNKTIPKVNDFQDKSDYYDRTLRGVLTRKTVCVGFAVIFKELANRNGIDCKLVKGSSFNLSNGNSCGHAWNLIKIGGVVYPVDVTYKNTRYRNGDFSNIENISCDIEHFKKTHRPYDKEDNIGLTKIDEDIVMRAKKKTTMKKHYNATTYVMERKDKTKFVLSQIGMYRCVYRYLYSEINDDGSYGRTTIFFSESNLVKEINAHKFEKSDYYNEFIDSFINVLFSKENLNDSKVNKNTSYIGYCELSNEKRYVTSPLEIKKTDRAMKCFCGTNIKSKKREDGSVITIVQIPNRINNNMAYEYYIYILSEGPKVMEYNIFSNTDYYSLEPNLVVNSILSENSLNESIQQGGRIR